MPYAPKGGEARGKGKEKGNVRATFELSTYNGPNPFWGFVTVFILCTALMAPVVVLAPVYFLVVLPVKKAYAWLAGLMAPGTRVRSSVNTGLSAFYFLGVVCFSVLTLVALYVLFIVAFLPVFSLAFMPLFACRQLVGLGGQCFAWLAGMMARKEPTFVDAREVFDMSLFEKICAWVATARKPKFNLAAESGAMSFEELLDFLYNKNLYEVHHWLAANAGNVHGFDMLNSIAVSLKEAREGKHGADALRVLTSTNAIIVIIRILHEILVGQAKTVGPLKLVRAKNPMLDFFHIFVGLGGVYPGVAVLLRGLEVAHDMARHEEVTSKQCDELYVCTKELLHIFPEDRFDERCLFGPIFQWSDTVYDQLVTVVNSKKVVAKSVAGKEAVEKGLRGWTKMVDGVGRLVVRGA